METAPFLSWLDANPCPQNPIMVPWWVFKSGLVAVRYGAPIDIETARTIAEKTTWQIPDAQVLCLLYVAAAFVHSPEYFGEYLSDPKKAGGLN